MWKLNKSMNFLSAKLQKLMGITRQDSSQTSNNYKFKYMSVFSVLCLIDSAQSISTTGFSTNAMMVYSLAWPGLHNDTSPSHITQHPSYHICKGDQIDKDKSSTTMECELDFSLISASSLSLRYLHVIIILIEQPTSLHHASDQHPA